MVVNFQAQVLLIMKMKEVRVILGGQGHPVNVDRRVQKSLFLNRLRLNAFNLQLKIFGHRNCRMHPKVPVGCKMV